MPLGARSLADAVVDGRVVKRGPKTKTGLSFTSHNRHGNASMHAVPVLVSLTHANGGMPLASSYNTRPPLLFGPGMTEREREGERERERERVCH